MRDFSKDHRWLSLNTATVRKQADFVGIVEACVKHGIRAVVATAREQLNRQAVSTVRPLHYGVWEFAASERLPFRSRWIPGAGWKLSRAIGRSRPGTGGAPGDVLGGALP